MDKYEFDRTIETPSATIRIHRPIISEEERNRRLKGIHDAAAQLLLDLERKER